MSACDGGAVHSGVRVRPYRACDKAAVLDLIAADRLPGQPSADADALGMALAGTAGVSDAGARAWWGELEAPRTTVAAAADHTVIGACSVALRPADHSGQILWLHAREDARVAQALVDHAVEVLDGGRALYAYTCGPAWTLAADGMPVRRRPATHRALESAGFTVMGEESYWQCRNKTAQSRPDHRHYPLAQLEPSREPPGWHLNLTDTAGHPVASALLGAPTAGIGVLWWLQVEPAVRGRGVGRVFLQQCLEEFTACGATRVIALIDQRPPGSDRPDPAAAPLLRRAGFREVDTLYTYHRAP